MNAPANFPIGRLSHRLTLESPVRTPDGGGGCAITWEAIADMWAAVETPAGSERVEGGRLSGTAKTRITIRNRDDVTPAMRFRTGAQVFEIIAVRDVDGRRRYLVCDCERRDQ
ncbi:MAG: phage head closure protein [Alphaproteobacteria bacterium]